ncbi:uncharacterized protein BKA55DRAFT_314852 [Fusarium redolens]|jgi:hypothetical protein|uniref:Uncharacterized protein n=1 Tax=Fusarium redolens TaxID=48865 RepID=A0A9P9HD11_FUSRE|nr:uncharacterized protein BKA55DRAFT_314852 [Fusarium redolens]KAH7255385.1 hypothetical protein BKA55DRAFT_314852 [Fusarium redolens]
MKLPFYSCFACMMFVLVKIYIPPSATLFYYKSIITYYSFTSYLVTCIMMLKDSLFDKLQLHRDKHFSTHQGIIRLPLSGKGCLQLHWYLYTPNSTKSSIPCKASASLYQQQQRVKGGWFGL